jgi:two-component sensor histidine kinase
MPLMLPASLRMGASCRSTGRSSSSMPRRRQLFISTTWLSIRTREIGRREGSPFSSSSWTVEARQAAEELARKELLLREIHHRVKNNMQVISSLLYLQARQAGDPRLEAILEENRRRIRSMALIHEKLYQSEQTGSVRLAPYLRDLTNNLLIAYGVGAPGARLELAVGEEMELALDTAILLGLLVGELASNSLKHAFTGGIGGVLRIALEPCGEGAFRLEVGDDGVGLPVGCDARTSQSMGFKLVRLFAAQLEASLEVERDSGVSFRFLFKPGR